MEPMTLAFSMLLLGLALVLLDLFIPSHGILSLLGGAALLFAITIGFRQGVRQGAMMVAIVGFSGPFLFFVIVKWWPHTPIGRLIILQQPEDPELILPEEPPVLHELVGKVGEARSDMLPGGAVVVAGQSWDAISEGKPIDAGTPVKVVAIRMGRLVVRRATPDDLARTSELEADSLLTQPVENWDFEGEWDNEEPA